MEFGAKPGERIVERFQFPLPDPQLLCTPQEQALLLYGGLPYCPCSGFRRKKPGEQTRIGTEETGAQDLLWTKYGDSSNTSSRRISVSVNDCCSRMGLLP